MKQKFLTKRDRDIVSWHEKNYTQQYIADKLGLTRQRVQQLETKLGLKRERRNGRKEHICKCKECKKTFVSPAQKRLFCSRDCFYQSRKLNLSPRAKTQLLEEKKKRAREKASAYYYNVIKKRPDFHQLIKERNRRYATSTANK